MSTSEGAQKVVQRQAWSESERQEIRDYAEANPKSTWRTIKHWFEGAHPNKGITQSQISRILNPKRPRRPSDASIAAEGHRVLTLVPIPIPDLLCLFCHVCNLLSIYA